MLQVSNIHIGPWLKACLLSMPIYKVLSLQPNEKRSKEALCRARTYIWWFLSNASALTNKIQRPLKQSWMLKNINPYVKKGTAVTINRTQISYQDKWIHKPCKTSTHYTHNRHHVNTDYTDICIWVWQSDSMSLKQYTTLQ